MNGNPLAGKVVLISGAGKGRGRTLAEGLAQRGAQVAVNDISPVNLEALVAAGGGRIRAYVEDVARKMAVQSMLKQVEDDLGRIDLLIHHAAVQPRVRLLDMDEWDWRRVLDVNLNGAFLLMQSVARMMRAQGSGVILNWIGLPPPGVQDDAAYRASMWALLSLTRSASVELSPFGIRVHALGTGLAEFQQAETGLPRKHLVETVTHLYTSPLSGQIVDVEAE